MTEEQKLKLKQLNWYFTNSQSGLLSANYSHKIYSKHWFRILNFNSDGPVIYASMRKKSHRELYNSNIEANIETQLDPNTKKEIYFESVDALIENHDKIFQDISDDEQTINGPIPRYVFFEDNDISQIGIIQMDYIDHYWMQVSENNYVFIDKEKVTEIK